MVWVVVIISHIYIICFGKSISLGWICPEAGLATWIWVQVVYLGGDSRRRQ